MELDYQLIADIIQKVIPEGWKKAIFMAEYTSGSYSMRCFYDNGDGEYKDCLATAGNAKVQVIKLFKEVDHEIQNVRKMLEGNKLWYAVTIRIDSNGGFKAEYDYDSHEGNTIGYIENWKTINL